MRILYYVIPTFIIGFLLLLLEELAIYIILLAIASAIFYGVSLLKDMHDELVENPRLEERYKQLFEPLKDIINSNEHINEEKEVSKC